MSVGTESVSERWSKYSTLVYARNRHAGYGKEVVVVARSRQEAINRAVDLGWSGYPSDARVLVKSVEDLDPRECPHAIRQEGTETNE